MSKVSRKIGVDPGLSGALVLIEDGKVIEWTEMPVTAKPHGKGNQIDCFELAKWIADAESGGAYEIYIERVSARPGNGVTGMFAFGHALGAVEALAASYEMLIHWVLPTVWKRRAGLLKADKDAARLLVREQHPELRDALRTKKSVGIADAVLIAEHGDP